jgi:hypothetical protein
VKPRIGLGDWPQFFPDLLTYCFGSAQHGLRGSVAPDVMD